MVTLEQFRYLPACATRTSSCLDFHYSTPGMVAILGDNGSGKSTLAQLMAGWYPDFYWRYSHIGNISRNIIKNVLRDWNCKGECSF